MSKKRRTKGSSAKKPRPDVKTLAGSTAAVHIPEQSTPVTVNPWDAEDDVDVQFHRHETDRSQPGADSDGFTMAPRCAHVSRRRPASECRSSCRNRLPEIVVEI